MKKVTIFSDGAVSPNPGFGGYAALLMFDLPSEAITVSKIFSGHPTEQTTNQRMEMTAVAVALESLSAPCDVVLWTDSKYVLNGMTKWCAVWEHKQWKTAAGDPVKNKDLWIRMMKAEESHKVEYRWIRGHSDSLWNEIVDMVAVNEREKAERESHESFFPSN